MSLRLFLLTEMVPFRGGGGERLHSPVCAPSAQVGGRGGGGGGGAKHTQGKKNVLKKRQLRPIQPEKSYSNRNAASRDYCLLWAQ
jgi:hypothetical protein